MDETRRKSSVVARQDMPVIEGEITKVVDLITKDLERYSNSANCKYIHFSYCKYIHFSASSMNEKLNCAFEIIL